MKNSPVLLVPLLALATCRPHQQDVPPAGKEENSVLIEKQEIRLVDNAVQEVQKKERNERQEGYNYAVQPFYQSPTVNPFLEYVNRSPLETSSYLQPPEEKSIDLPSVRRKIEHQQTIIVPLFPDGGKIPVYYAPYYGTNLLHDGKKATTAQSLQEQAVKHVKNIVDDARLYPVTLYGTPVPFYPLQQQERQLQWPLGQYFPIFIKDPLQQIVNAVTSTVEYGQQAGVSCPGGRPPKMLSEERANSLRVNSKKEKFSGITDAKFAISNILNRDVREKQSLPSQDSTGTGVFIHKLRVSTGGVAIAGPGGVATAGRGGTAIVGPNGYAYTQPNSLAIAGSGAKVVAVNPNVNLTELISGANFNAKNALSPDIGKVVAVGPVVYYNKKTESKWTPLALSYLSPLQTVPNPDYIITTSRPVGNIAPYKSHPTFGRLKSEGIGRWSLRRTDYVQGGDVATIILKPAAKAIAGVEGKAIALPLSRAVLREGTDADILYEPEAVAVAGPGGIAHAQSDLDIFYESVR